MTVTSIGVIAEPTKKTVGTNKRRSGDPLTRETHQSRQD